MTVVVDQFAAWEADSRLRVLPPNGGFARLRREGTWVRDMRYAHAITETGPGHSALYTGRPPHESGIGVDSAVDRTGRRISLYSDPATQLVGPNGPLGQIGRSSALLRVETIAERLRAEYPKAKIASISLKDRSALLPMGRAASDCVWFDAGADSFVTSTAYGDTFPSWARPLGVHQAIVRARRDPWVPLDAAWLRANAPTPDNQPGEASYARIGTVFPHVLTTDDPAHAFCTCPMADEVEIALAEGAITSATNSTGPTLIALSFSAHDYIGHAFGPDSWEALDELRRLDAALARFMTWLDAHVGDDWAMMLAADHGVASLPELGKTPGATRISNVGTAAELERIARAQLGPGRWISSVEEPYIILSEEAHALPPSRFDALVARLSTWLGAQPYVERVFDPRSFSGPCPPESDDSVEALVCRSVVLSGPGDVYVVLRPGSFFDPDMEEGRGVSHGTPWLSDRSVPLFVRAPNRVPAGKVLEGPRSYATFARTASALLGIAFPAAHEGADLTRTTSR